MLFHLEIGNAIAKQPAQAVVLLKHRHSMTGAGELLGAGKPRRTGTDDGNPLAAPALGRLRLNPALLPAAIDDLAFDRLDRDRRVIRSEGPPRGEKLVRTW